MKYNINRIAINIINIPKVLFLFNDPLLLEDIYINKEYFFCKFKNQMNCNYLPIQIFHH
jgi:hypothetical protein